MSFWTLGQLRTLLTTETDADSPGSQELLDQIRENIEALMILTFADGFTGTVTVIAETVLTHGGVAQDANEHNGRTLLITSGSAIGNMYTITATAAQTITCGGVTMVTDGVAVDDTFRIMYDVKVNADGHDHDGVNSKLLGVAIKQAGLDTSTFEAKSTAVAKNMAVTGGSYCFYPQVQTDNFASPGIFQLGIDPNTQQSVYETFVYIDGSAGGAVYDYAQFRYINSSGERHWIFSLRNKITGIIEGQTQAPDHPCFGNGGDPDQLSHPFVRVNLNTHEVIVTTPSKSEIRAIRRRARETKKSFLKVITNEYEIDDKSKPKWPTEEISVDHEFDDDDKIIAVIRKKIKKQPYFIHKKLKKKI